MLQIKKSHKDTVIAFNNSGVPLGKRSQSDLVDLAIMGLSSGHKLIINAFEEPLPSLDELKKMKLTALESSLKSEEKPAKTSEVINNDGKENSTAKEKGNQK